MKTTEIQIEPDHLERITELFTAMDKRIGTVEAGLDALLETSRLQQKGVTLIGNGLLLHQQVFAAIALALADVRDHLPTGEGATLAQLRKALDEIEQLRRMFEKDPGPDSIQ